MLVITPFGVIILNSFKNKKEAAEMTLSLPTDWNIINNYSEVLQTGIVKAFGNSCFITLLSVTLIIVTTALAAFVLQRRATKAMSRLTSLFIIGLIIPGQIIPTYIICNYLHLSTFLGAAVVLTAANIPLGVFMYIGFLKSIPSSIDEAAIVDGCNSLQLFFKVIFPLLKPMTITLFILNFMNIWNDFGTTIYFLNSSENYTLTLTIYNYFSTHSSDWNLVFADVVAVSLPVIIIYFSAQKHIMSGMTSGAVKG
jgi:raffinose/stachyose/melibiose transport system permease protein